MSAEAEATYFSQSTARLKPHPKVCSHIHTCNINTHPYTHTHPPTHTHNIKVMHPLF